MISEKALGTKAFQEKDYAKAVEHFSNALKETPDDHTLYSNRSACFYNSNQFDHALEDADKCIQVKPDWGKGYQRKAMALHAMGRYDEAIPEYEKGIQYDPTNAQIQ